MCLPGWSTIDEWLARVDERRIPNSETLLAMDGGGMGAEAYARRCLSDMGYEPSEEMVDPGRMGRLVLLVRMLARELFEARLRLNERDDAKDPDWEKESP